MVNRMLPSVDRMQPSVETAASRVVGNLSPSDKRGYSYIRMINYLASERRNLCLEGEVSNALAKELPLSPAPKAGFVPLSLSGQRSGLDSKSGSSGGFMAATDVSRDLIELLRGKNLLLNLGAVLLPLDHARAMPVEVSGSTATWTSENSGDDVDDTDMVYGARIAFPHSLMVTSALSKKLLSQTSAAAEAFVRADLARAISNAIDVAGFNGSGLSNEPVGILQTSGIGAVIGGSNGATPDFQDILDLEYAISVGNADVASMAYVSTPGIRRLLKKTQEVSGSSKMIWTGNQVNGLLAAASTNVPSNLSKGSSSKVCHALICGDFSQLIIAQFGGGMALTVDPFTLARRAMIEVTCYIDVDLVLRRPESFAVMADALLS